ncbi:CHAT domain-containing protein [Nostoc sphaeroides]|uniref:CHAT domain-containing protein n=1 Tax=Nostoc sphaeroides CCNUC1 TaxID=2653204 RepID=A0A5P8WD84_9NOSO|nr:CHAT domain-containing protein [Nostoc sphaeroides]MCC5632182.1 CHAT domain-containing protein [Nostoc sphaeroides CHAB 2801]QFS50106.1 CHAT domain-containing protein [Nostoc sphaeroides CCNUC1]
MFSSRFWRKVQRRVKQSQTIVQRNVNVIILVALFLVTTVLPSAAQKVAINIPSPGSLNAENLVQQGRALYEAQQFGDAVKTLELAAANYARNGDELRLAMTLRNLSLAYQELGLWTEAQEAITKGFKLLEKLNNSPSRSQILAQTLDVQGHWQLARGQAETALQTWEQAAKIYTQTGDWAKFTRNRIVSAEALQMLGLYTQAKKILTQVQQSLEKQEDSALKSIGLRSLGDVLRIVGDLNESQQVLKQSLKVALSLQANPEIAEALISLANAAQDQGDTEASLDFYRQAAAISIPPSMRIQLLLNQFSFLLKTKQWSSALALVSQVQSEINKLPPSRIAAYAQINFAQNLARLKQEANEIAFSWIDIAHLLAKAIEQTQSLEDKRAESYALGTLGWLYEQRKQFTDAQSLTQKALFIAQSIDASDIGYQWEWQMGRLLKNKGDNKEAISYYSKAIETLQSLRSDLATTNQGIQFTFRESVEPVYRELVELLVQTKGNLEPPPDNLRQARFLIETLQLAELDNFFRQACLTAKVEIDQVVEQDQSAAIVYPIILPDHLEVILKLPGQKDLKHYATNIVKQDVERTLEQLQVNIPEPHTLRLVQSLSAQVYDWLIRPAEAELGKNEIKTLVFVLDGALRNIPMASLYDGKQYLIEKYALALTPGLQLFDPKALPKRQLQALTAGLSEARLGFSALPNVERELQAIKLQVETKVLLNQQFTSEALQKQMKSLPFKVIHLATHGQFSSDVNKTFVLSWDKQIKVNELSDFLRTREENKPEPVELLVLSACETASGDNRAALGLAGVAVRAGARSTLASLWNIDDQSTSILMSYFYQELAKIPNITKAEALRRAQLALLQNPSYQRPRFWAPYVLVGNWL